MILHITDANRGLQQSGQPRYEGDGLAINFQFLVIEPALLLRMSWCSSLVHGWIILRTRKKEQDEEYE